MPQSQTAKAARLSGPALILHLEGAVVFAGACFAFAHLDASWWLFAALLLAPDLAMLGYLANPRLGAIIYNLAHSYVGPALLLGAALATTTPLATTLAIIWIAHIGMDRMLGYGLKYPDGFKPTHLSRI